MRLPPLRSPGLHLALALLVCGAADPAAADEPVSFNRDIRPILSNQCFECHGPDEQSRSAGLALHMPGDALADRNGAAAIVPGDPGASLVIQRIRSENEDERMPPPETGRELTEQQIQLLERWIEQGAVWENHWAFEPVVRHEPPAVERQDWPRNPIDRFILAELEERGIEPAPEADRYTLIRRLHLDLIGLPPTPEQVDAFVADERPDAYERLVERLLESPHYGERWGRHWLDQARYADSHGYSIDSPRPIWPYRDWVIEALNDDMPFDRFTIEQLAGDLLEEPTRDQLVATGFHRNTLVNQEGGTDPEQFRVEAAVDRVNTTGTVWLGLSVACAQCHTHKYDPITHHEYFSLYAFFNQAQDRNTEGPTIDVPTAEQAEQRRRLQQEVADLRRALEQRDDADAEDRAAWERHQREPTAWQVAEPLDARSEAGASLRRLEDGSLLAEGTHPERDRYTIEVAAPAGPVTALRLEALTHESLPRGGPGRAANGNFVFHHITLADPEGREVAWARAVADHSQRDYEVRRAIDGQTQSKSGWAINVPEGSLNVDRTALFALAEPLEVEAGSALTVTLHFGPDPSGYQIGRLRLSLTDAPDPNLGDADPLPELLAIPAAERTPEQEEAIRARFLKTDPERADLQERLQAREEQLESLQRRIPRTMVMRDRREPRETHVHIRGDFLRKGDRVEPGVPEVLPPLEADSANGERPTRLDLARWLVDPQNPLTPRVTVNRIWMRYFGQGLVETENDFGMQGTLPTHPQLLDWLAGEFVASGWSMKAMHRLIVHSATYRQSSRMRPDLDRVDPQNRLLARQARFRVEAEVVRDLALGASGALTPRIGGPSIYPPQADGVYAFTQRRQAWPTSEGAERFRRSLYIFLYRSAPYPLLTTFDMPRMDSACTSRIRSNTPLQALTMANDPGIFELARKMAYRLVAEPHGGDEARMQRAFRLALARPPRTDERSRLLDFLELQRQRFGADPQAAREVAGEGGPDGADRAEVAAWTAAARVLMNLDEFVTRE